MVEGGAADAVDGAGQLGSFVLWLRRVALSGGLLIGLMVFQVEFDFGVPQFRLVFRPILVMLAAGVALVATRIWLGRGRRSAPSPSSCSSAAGVSVIVGPVLGERPPTSPLFIVEALAVEASSSALPRARPLTLGLWSGLAIGTVGLAAEWAWTHVWMPIPWPADLLPEALLFGLLAASPAPGRRLGRRAAGVRQAAPLRATRGAVAGAVAIFALVGFALAKPPTRACAARSRLADAGPGQARQRRPCRSTRPARPTGAEWVTVTAWQGGGLVVDRSSASARDLPTDRAGPGERRLEDARPAALRGNSLTAVPIYLPDDPAIPAEGSRQRRRFERPFVADHEILQREQKDAAGWLTPLAYLPVALFPSGSCS